MAITYKTVIANAIKGFNDIQGKLATFTDLGISAVTTSDSSVTGSITPAAMITAIGNMATIKKSDGTFVSGKVTYRGSASATVNPTLSGTTVSYSKTLSAGYYTGGTISGSLNLGAGSATVTPAVTQKTYSGTSTTALTTDILATSAPSSGSYYRIEMDPSSSTTSFSEGYFAAKSGITNAGGTTVNRYLAVSNCSRVGLGSSASSDVSGIKITHTAGYIPAGNFYVNDITVKSSGTLNSVSLSSKATLNSLTLAAGVDDSNRTVIGSLVLNSYTKINQLSNSGKIMKLINPGIVVEMYSESDNGNRITTLHGSTTVNYLGTSTNAGTMTIADNTYGTVNVWNAGADKGVQVSNHTVKVDGTTVTNSSGDLKTATPAFDGGGLTVTNPTVTLEKGEETNNSSGINITSSITDKGATEPTSGYYVAIKANAAAITATRADVLYNGAVDGWVKVSDNAKVSLSSSSTKSNSAVSATEYFQIPAGSHNVTVENSVTKAKVTVKEKSESGSTITTSSTATDYYVNITGSVTNGSVTSNATCTSTAGYIGAGTDTASDTDAVGVTLTEGKIYVPAASAKATPSVGITQQYKAGSATASNQSILLDSDPGTSTNRYILKFDPSVSIGSQSAGYLPASGGITAASGDTLTKYISEAKGSVTNGTATKVKVTAAIDSSTAGEIGKLKDTTNSGISTDAPGNDKTLGTDYWKITPTSSTTDGSVSAAIAKITTAGYTPTNESFATGSKVTVGVTKNAVTPFYVSKATFETSTSGSGVSVTTTTGGYIPSGVTVGSANISGGTISTGTTNQTTYVQNTTAIVPSQGYLYIGAGYYPNTQISLDTLLGGQYDTSDGTSSGTLLPIPSVDYIRAGYTVYTLDGKALTGTMADWNPDDTYYTTTNTRYGVVTGYTYVNSATKYIKEGTLSATATATASVSTTMTTISKPSTGTDGTDYFSITGSAHAVAESSVSAAGWIAANTIEGDEDGKDEKKYIAKSTLSVTGAGALSAPSISVNTTDGSNAGVNVGGIIGSRATTEPTSGYYIRLNTAANSTGKSITATTSEGYTKGESASGTVTLSSSNNQYFPVTKATQTHAGGGLTVPNPTVTLAVGDTDGTGNVTSFITDKGATEPTSGYYIAIKANAAAITATRAAVTSTDTAGYLPGGSHTCLAQTTKANSAVNKTEYFQLPEGTHAHSGGGLSKGTASGGGLSGGGLSGGGLSVTTNYSGTPTVDIVLGDAADSTISGASVVETKPASGYYIEVTASSSALSGKTKVTRAAVTRAAVNRAAFSQKVNRGAVTCTETEGWVPAGSHTCLAAGSTTVTLAAGSLAADSTTIGSTYAEPTVTVNKGSKSEYVVVPKSVITNGFVTDPGYVPKDTQKYLTQYNATDDCVDVIFNG